MPKGQYLIDMQKIEQLVANLSHHEGNAFKEYLHSPYFKMLPETEKLYEFLRQNLKNKLDFNKAHAFKHLHKNKRYSDKQMRYLVSDLTKHLEYFYTLRFVDSNITSLHLLSLKALAKKDLNKSWSFIHQEINRINKPGNADTLLLNFQVADIEEDYLSSTQSRKRKPNYEELLQNLDAFYVVKKLQLACEVINYQNILKSDLEINLLDEIKLLAQRKQFKDFPALQIYYNILLSLTEPDEQKHFLKAKEMIIKHELLFPAKELDNLFIYLKNYCVKKLNQGSQEYLQELFGLYKVILTNKKLMNYAYLSQFEFKNMVSISMRLNEKDWCSHFIKNYIGYLAPAERKNALDYNMAYQYFSNGDFKNAIRKLVDVEFTDLVYQLDSRVILLKCYYELGDEEVFFYHASAFRLFLLRNRYISEYQRTINRNLIKYLTALVRAGKSKPKITRIAENLEKEKNVADLKWLIEKIKIKQAGTGRFAF